MKTWILSSLTLSLMIGIGESAYALPLLSENAAQRVGGVLTLYPDHERKDLFYFIPNSSALVRDETTGVPMFGLTYWGLGSGGSLDQAGGFMVFSALIQSNATQKALIDSFIRDGKKVAVIPVQASTVELTSTKDSSQPLGKIFEEFTFSKKAGLFESEIALNSVLTGLGAKIMRAAISNPTLMKLDYCFSIQGLSPAFDAKISVDWQKVYSHFSSKASGGGFFVKWQVSSVVEQLWQNKDIDVQINGGDATHAEYVRALTEKIVERLFKPELKNLPESARQRGWSFTRLSLNKTEKREYAREEWTLKQRLLVEQEYCLPIHLRDLADYKDKVVVDADK